MSTFTQWNGPQGASGPSAKDITALIDAYNSMSSALQAHLAATAPTDSAVHGIVNYVNSIKTELQALLGAKAENTALSAVKETADAAATKQALLDAVQNMEQLISAKADTKALAAKADTALTDTMQKSIDTITEMLDKLQAEWDKFAAYYTDETTALAFSVIIKTTEYFIGKAHVHYVIDFTKWSHFTAPYAGTGTQDSSDTNGIFILGCLSMDWADDDNAPEKEQSAKAARAYIKYVNTNPFDAIIDMSATKADGKFTGSLSVHISKKAGTWQNMKFHLVHGTDSKGNEAVYLGVSSSKLASAGSDYSNVNFHVAGVNFLAPGQIGFVVPTGLLNGITDAAIGAGADSAITFDDVTANSFMSNNYQTLEAKNLLHIEVLKDPDGIGKDYEQLFIGNEDLNDITFTTRPSMVVKDQEGNQHESYFVTSQDIKNCTIPVGTVFRWPFVDEVTGKLVKVPKGFMACDGSQFNALDYPELAELCGADEFGNATLPVEDHAIIKAYYFDMIDKSSTPDFEEIINFSTLNKKINKETTRATGIEKGLSTRIDNNAAAIEAETLRATEAENTEKARAEAAEAAETTRATEAENTISASLALEVKRATDAEENITEKLTAETDRATAQETLLKSEIDTVSSNTADNTASIAAEKQRAETREAELQSAIEASDALTAAEQARAEAAENTLTEGLAAETDRATKAEAKIAEDLATETSRAIEAETTLNERVDKYEVLESRLQGNIDAEQARAEAAEATLQQNITAEETRATEAEATEKARAEAVEAEITGKVTAEETRATEAETTLQQNITAEQTRAEAAEAEITGKVTAEQTRAEAAETTIQQNIDTEAQSREAADNILQQNIDTEKARAEAAEDKNAADIIKETSRATEAERALSDRITEIHPDGN